MLQNLVIGVGPRSEMVKCGNCAIIIRGCSTPFAFMRDRDRAG